VIAMVVHAQSPVDHLGNALGGPQGGPVAVGHGPLGQEPHETFFLFPGQAGGPARGRLGVQGRRPPGLQGIAPPQHAARMAPDASTNLMQGQLLFQQGRDTPSPFFQQFWRPVRSHGDTPFLDVSIILHYLCGSQ